MATVVTRKNGSPGETKLRAAPTEPPTSGAPSYPGDPNFMASLARGLAVIRAFSQSPQSQTIAQLSHKTGIPRAAVRRCLYTLAKLGYVTANDRHFSLQPKILTLGHAYLSSTPLVLSAQPYLDQINELVHESCSMAILDDDEILYVARSKKTTRIMSVDLRIGSRLPAYCSSMGRVLLAHLPPADLKAYLARVKLRPYTEHTVTSREKLAQILDEVRANGYSIVDQELELGLRSIAVPVKDMHGHVVSAINVGAQAARLSVRDMETRILPHLRVAAGELGSLLVA